MFLPSSHKYTLFSLALVALALLVVTTDFFNFLGDGGQRVFFILWGTLIIVFQVVGFYEWLYYKQPHIGSFNLWSRIASNIWPVLSLVVLVFGIIVATLDNFGDIDFFNDVGRTIFFGFLGFLMVVFYVMAFLTWRKSRPRLQQTKVGDFDAWSKSLSNPQQKQTTSTASTRKESSPVPKSVIISPSEKRRNVPAQGQHSRPVIVRRRK